jgi:hypothetical protein
LCRRTKTTGQSHSGEWSTRSAQAEVLFRLTSQQREIDLLLKEADPTKALPRKAREAVDAIRNFAAHPKRDLARLEIIDVEELEAEETIEELFEHFYVGPERRSGRRKRSTRSLPRRANHPPSSGY